MEWPIFFMTLLAFSYADITTDATTIVPEISPITDSGSSAPDLSLSTNSDLSEIDYFNPTPTSNIDEADETPVTTSATNLETSVILEPAESIIVETSDILVAPQRVSKITEEHESTTSVSSGLENNEKLTTLSYLDSSTIDNLISNSTEIPLEMAVDGSESSQNYVTESATEEVEKSEIPTQSETFLKPSTELTKEVHTENISESAILDPVDAVPAASQIFTVQAVTASTLSPEKQTLASSQSQIINSLVQPTHINNKIASKDSNATIVNQENIMNSDGSYNHSYESSNGISIQAEGVSRNYNRTYNSSDVNSYKPTRNIVVSGGFSWTSPNGQKVSIKYTADENGYHPVGDAIPTPPPIPPQIAKALAWIRKVLAEKKEKELNEARQKS